MEWVRVLNENLKVDAWQVTITKVLKKHVEGYTGDTMKFRYGKCANIMWVSTLELNDIIHSRSDMLLLYNSRRYWV